MFLMMNIGRNRFPFTASQWQELEHQALIYKYMASGIPIPTDLIFLIKRSSLDSPFSSKLFPCQPSHLGWSCLQMGLGRKIDPEPGRCRRTDGKKWRCSKEAYPDSKYCERHMHRGKNRSRKHVELGTTTNNGNATSTTITKNSSLSPSFPQPPSSHSLSLMPPDAHHHQMENPLRYPGQHKTTITNYQFLSSPNTSSSETLGFGSLDSSSFTNIDYRNRNAEHAFFSSPSVDDTWQLTPLTISSSSNSSSSKQRGPFPHQSYGLMERADKEAEPQKTVHRFFDEWPPRNKDSPWLDADDKSSSASVSTTRLSISIPSSSHDFPIFGSSSHYDG